MKRLSDAALLIAFFIGIVVYAVGGILACSAAQKTDAKAAATCTVDDAQKIIAILERSDLNAAQKLEQLGLQVGPDVVACVTAQAKQAATAGSGSAK